MALTPPKPPADDPRLKDHQTTYSASRGGHYPSQPKSVPGTPKG
ncbi:hypothetical protein [Streptomyces racemochromogenes]